MAGMANLNLPTSEFVFLVISGRAVVATTDVVVVVVVVGIVVVVGVVVAAVIIIVVAVAVAVITIVGLEFGRAAMEPGQSSDEVIWEWVAGVIPKDDVTVPGAVVLEGLLVGDLLQKVLHLLDSHTNEC
jgi:hypothetical protein